MMILVVTLISAFWTIVGHIMTAFGIVQLVVQLNSFVNTIATYTPDFVRYIGYVYFFIDRSRLIPLVSITLGLTMFRICCSLLKLISW